MRKRSVKLVVLLVSIYFFAGFSTWSGAAEFPSAANPAVNNIDSDADGLPDWWEISFFGNLSQRGNSDPDRDGYSNRTELKVGTSPADGRDAPVPAGIFFKYDAFGRMVEKQVTLE